MKHRVRLLGAVMLMMATVMTLSSTAQGAEKIAFATDQTTADDYNVWKMDPDGTNQTAVVTGTGNHRNPSISHNGDHFVYDQGNDLWIVDADGNNVTNLTGGSSGACTGTELCNDPDASPRINADNDFLIAFTRTHVPAGQTVTNIYFATVDISTRTLSNFEPITSETQTAAGAQIDPAWCGNRHVIWSRVSPNSTSYYREICVVKVDPLGTPTCYFGEQTDDKDDTHPSCSLDATQIAWTRGDAYGTSDIYRMDCVDGPDSDKDQFNDCDTAGADNLTGSIYYEDVHPVFNLAGNRIAWAKRYYTDDDFEIYTMNSSGSEQQYRTDNDAEDLDPDWGPDQ